MNTHFRLAPPSASSFAPQVDALTFVLLALSAVIIIGVFGLMLYFCVKYHEGSTANRRSSPDYHEKSFRIEVLWTLIPLGAFLVLCAWGSVVYFKMHRPPPGASEIFVVGKQWMWKFQHSNGKEELGELHVPVGVPVKLTMTSQDVIHSFFVPAFRIKQDVLPDRYTTTWFQATRPGEYHLFCSQYCGLSHADMGGTIVAMKPADFEEWLQTGVPKATLTGYSRLSSMAERGRQLFKRLGCVLCHGTGSTINAPKLEGVYGHEVPLSDGQTVFADENYLRESILNPHAKIVAGFQAIMPPFAGVVNDEELLDLISYIKSLGSSPVGTAAAVSELAPSATSKRDQ